MPIKVITPDALATLATTGEATRVVISRLTHREKSVPDEIRALIPVKQRGEETCLRFLAGIICPGGTRDRCSHSKRVHGWLDGDIPRCLKEWSEDTYARRRGWDAERLKRRDCGRT